MKIKIEVDLTPAELRALIGLPDVAGLQDDMIEYLRERVSGSVDGFNPTEFLKENVQVGKTWRKFVGLAKGAEEAATKPATKKRTTRKSTSPSRTSSKKKTTARRKPKAS